MSFYLDASTILPFLVEEPSTETVQEFLRTAAAPLIVSEFAAAEVASGLSRSARMGAFTREAATARLADFDAWRAGGASEIDLQAADFRLASLFVRRFDLALRAPDALHAAICRRGDHTLVTLDRRLARAAEALGVRVSGPRVTARGGQWRQTATGSGLSSLLLTPHIPHRRAKLHHQRVALAHPRAEHVEQRAVVSERALPAGLEAGEDVGFDRAHIGRDRAGVVEFVAGRDQQDVGRRVARVGQIRRLPLPPGRLHAFAVGDAVGAPSTMSATRSPNVARPTARRRSPQTYSLDDVMQQAGDGLILVAAMVEDERTNPREVREVGDVCASAKLAVVVCSSRRRALAAHSTRPQIGG